MKEENEKIEKDEEDNGLAMGMSLGMSCLPILVIWQVKRMPYVWNSI